MPISATNARRSIRTAQASGLNAKRSGFNQSGYRVYYRLLGADSWTLVGMIDAAASPLQIAMPVLPDGEYEVKLGLQGYHWDEFEHIQRGRFKLAGGVLVAALPAISDLGNIYEATETSIVWLFKAQAGVDTPDDFALWTSATSPVSTAGAPLATVRQDGFHRYLIRISQAGAIYAAVAARKGAQVGPASEILVPAPETLPGAPADQYATDEILDEQA